MPAGRDRLREETDRRADQVFDAVRFSRQRHLRGGAGCGPSYPVLTGGGEPGGAL